MTKTEEISIWLSMLMTILLKFQYPHHHPRGAGFVWLVSLLFLTHANVLAAMSLFNYILCNSFAFLVQLYLCMLFVCWSTQTAHFNGAKAIL
jgi:ABC-type transport system involved in cytochrome c biogenesis permease subunit